MGDITENSDDRGKLPGLEEDWDSGVEGAGNGQKDIQAVAVL